MSARARVLMIVAVAAGLAVAGTVGVTLLQTRGESTTAPGAVTKPHRGRPPLFLDFGVRGDRETLDLSHAAGLANHGQAGAGGRDLRPLPLAAGADRPRLRALA